MWGTTYINKVRIVVIELKDYWRTPISARYLYVLPKVIIISILFSPIPSRFHPGVHGLSNSSNNSSQIGALPKAPLAVLHRKLQPGLKRTQSRPDGLTAEPWIWTSWVIGDVPFSPMISDVRLIAHFLDWGEASNQAAREVISQRGNGFDYLVKVIHT